jgi:heme/copper-type cytochrome/quinol oxidase subunit 2
VVKVLPKAEYQSWLAEQKAANQEAAPAVVEAPAPAAVETPAEGEAGSATEPAVTAAAAG